MTVKLLSLTWDNTTGQADLALDANGFLDSASGFETAVTISLFTHARVDDLDPTISGQKMGWWGDTYAEHEGDRIGSKLWTLRRAKVNPATLQSVKAFCLQALAWMVEDGIAKSVAVEVERLDLQAVAAKISITRQSGGRWTGIWEVHLNAL
jgi:phage gp46-like protein